MKTVWFNRGHYPAYIGFCPSKKEWVKQLKKMGCEDLTYPDSDGKCSTFDLSDGKRVVLVTIGEHIDSKDPIGICGLLVHEAVHAWQYLLEDIGQREPVGREIEAYGIQSLSQWLMEAYSSTRRINLE